MRSFPINSYTLFTWAIFFLLSGCSENIQVKIEPLTKSWEKVVPNQQIPEGLTSLKAEDCGTCHKAYYDEWKMSTHAHAWTDLQFQAEIKKESSPFMCINCHIPLQNQQEDIIEGLIDGDIYQPVRKKNPHFDKELQQEGITCVACHLRDNAIVGTMGSDKAPHKTIKDPEFLSEQLCISCHNAVAVVTPTLACSFETGDEWKAGPFYGQLNCKGCHMEEVDRPWVAGYEERVSHHHFFEGSGIPKFDSVVTNIKNGLSFRPTEILPKYSVGEKIDFTLRLKNEFAGHKVPTGDPERYFMIYLQWINENGVVVAEKEDRIGEHWEWHPKVKKISDNNLLPGEERNYTIDFTPSTQGKYTLKAKVEKHRLSSKNAAYNKLGDNYPLFITVYDESWDMVIR